MVFRRAFLFEEKLGLLDGVLEPLFLNQPVDVRAKLAARYGDAGGFASACVL